MTEYTKGKLESQLADAKEEIRTLSDALAGPPKKGLRVDITSAKCRPAQMFEKLLAATVFAVAIGAIAVMVFLFKTQPFIEVYGALFLAIIPVVVVAGLTMLHPAGQCPSCGGEQWNAEESTSRQW